MWVVFPARALGVAAVAMAVPLTLASKGYDTTAGSFIDDVATRVTRWRSKLGHRVPSCDARQRFEPAYGCGHDFHVCA
jgi:hypothetical protein